MMKNNHMLMIGAFLSLVILNSCKKEKPGNQPPAKKQITAFSSTVNENNGMITRDAIGTIGNDSILVDFPEGTNITKLRPTVTHTGKSITPDPKLTQNFSTPVNYTVTAEDGSSKTYVVMIRLLSSAKNITSFIFKVANNPSAISKDVAGIIENDSIKIYFPSVTALTSLTPTITSSGVSVSPANNFPVNFSNPVNYSVTAADGSVKTYTVICFINMALYFAGSDGNVYALNATTGEEIWKHRIGNITFSPTASQDKIYAVSANGYLYALDAKTGDERWKYSVGSYNSIPTVQDGIVYESGAGYMYMIDAGTGSLLKKIYSPGINPTVSDKRIYLPRSLYGGVAAVDATTGNSLWGYGSSGICISNPAIAGGTVYVGSEFYILSALDANSGALKWQIARDSDNGGGGGAPTYCNGAVYIVSYKNELFSLDASDGRIKWRKDYGRNLLSGPVAYDDIVYVSNAQIIYALDGKTGTEKWRYVADLYNESFTGCTYANGILYAGNANGNIYAIDANSGVVKWKHQTGAGVATNLCVVDVSKKVFHAGDSGDQN